MSTLMVTMSFDPERIDEARAHLRNDVMPWIVQQPGFVRGRWLASDDNTQGHGIVEFSSAAQATAAAYGPRQDVRDASRAWNIDSVSVLEIVGEA